MGITATIINNVTAYATAIPTTLPTVTFVPEVSLSAKLPIEVSAVVFFALFGIFGSMFFIYLIYAMDD